MKKRTIIIIILVIIIIMISFLLINWPKYNRPNIKIPILLYHDFVTTDPDSDPDNFNYINTPESFEENIKTFLNHGYTIISMQELYDAHHGKSTIPSKPLLIHMDDGYYSNYAYIYPILKKYNVKASIFIITDNIGKEVNGKKYLSWENCKEMQDSGLVEIFSHSKRHVFYNKLPVRTLRDDVTASYEEIEKNLGPKDLKVFAYPYETYTKETVWTLKINDIDMQVYDLGINNYRGFNQDYIKRINIPCEMTGIEIIDEINKTN